VSTYLADADQTALELQRSASVAPVSAQRVVCALSARDMRVVCAPLARRVPL
jgi:hypothetical protein